MTVPAIHHHDGGACPVDGKTLVRVRYRCGQPASQDWPAGKLRWKAWTWGESSHDITAWRLAVPP